MSNTVFLDRSRAGEPLLHDFRVWECNARDLICALRIVRPAVCKDATRFHLNGVLLDLEAGCVVATDGHRLHIAPVALPCQDYSVILPSWMVDAWLRLAKDCEEESLGARLGSTVQTTITHDASSGMVTLQGGPVSLQGLAVDATFPPWRQVKPSGYTRHVTINAGDLRTAIKGAKQDLKQAGKIKTSTRPPMGVNLELHSDGAYLKPQYDRGNPERERPTTAIPLSGSVGIPSDNYTLGLDLRYLEQAIARADKSDAVSIWIEANSKHFDPVLVTWSDTECVIMPMRLDD